MGEVALNRAGGQGRGVRALSVGKGRGGGAAGLVWQCVVSPPIRFPLLVAGSTGRLGCYVGGGRRFAENGGKLGGWRVRRV